MLKCLGFYSDSDVSKDSSGCYDYSANCATIHASREISSEKTVIWEQVLIVPMLIFVVIAVGSTSIAVPHNARTSKSHIQPQQKAETSYP